jgi:hypothetical protein
MPWHHRLDGIHLWIEIMAYMGHSSYGARFSASTGEFAEFGVERRTVMFSRSASEIRTGGSVTG